MQHLPISPIRTLFMALWKSAGALVNPKGRWTNSYQPRWQVNAVLGIDDGAMGTCQHPFEIQSGEDSCTTKLIEDILNVWQWKAILDCDGV